MIGIADIAVVGQELAIRWDDGREDFLALSTLRRSCPCASCQGEPDALGRVVRPTTEIGPAGDQLKRYEFVGGYALQLHWADGHGTGIYSYAYLRGLAGEGTSH